MWISGARPNRDGLVAVLSPRLLLQIDLTVTQPEDHWILRDEVPTQDLVAFRGALLGHAFKELVAWDRSTLERWGSDLRCRKRIEALSSQEGRDADIAGAAERVAWGVMGLAEFRMISRSGHRRSGTRSYRATRAERSSPNCAGPSTPRAEKLTSNNQPMKPKEREVAIREASGTSARFSRETPLPSVGVTCRHLDVCVANLFRCGGAVATVRCPCGRSPLPESAASWTAYGRLNPSSSRTGYLSNIDMLISDKRYVAYRLSICHTGISNE